MAKTIRFDNKDYGDFNTVFENVKRNKHRKDRRDTKIDLRKALANV